MKPGVRERTDHHAGHPDAVAVLIDRRRPDVIVEAAPVVPRRCRSRCATSPVLCIAAFTTFVTHACPLPMSSGGCSPRFVVGITHETLGSEPSPAERK